MMHSVILQGYALIRTGSGRRVTTPITVMIVNAVALGEVSVLD